MIDWDNISSIDQLIKQANMTTTSQSFYNPDEPFASHDGGAGIDSTDKATQNKNLSNIESQDQQEPATGVM